MKNGYLATSQAAEYLNLHPETVRRKAKAGEIRGVQTPGGYWRFKVEWLDEYLEESTGEVRNTEGPATA